MLSAIGLMGERRGAEDSSQLSQDLLSLMLTGIGLDAKTH